MSDLIDRKYDLPATKQNYTHRYIHAHTQTQILITIPDVKIQGNST